MTEWCNIWLLGQARYDDLKSGRRFLLSAQADVHGCYGQVAVAHADAYPRRAR